MSIYTATVPQLTKMLLNLDGWLQKATDYAEQRSFDVDVLVQARLAPDQFTFAQQVQSACDSAKFAAARLAQKEAPKHEDNETTIAQLRARIKAVVAYLGDFSEDDFKDCKDRIIRLPFLPPGKAVKGRHYVNDMALPNFYFHITTAYAILRHNGVAVGKRDFIGSMSLEDVDASA